MADREVEVAPRLLLRASWWRRNAVVVSLVVLLVALAWQHRWTFEDGFINFRIVKQLEAGHGPVFNHGQRVEVYTSPLWLFVLAVSDVLTPLRIEWLSVFLGIGFTAIGLTLGILGSRQLWSGLSEGAMEFPAGALVIVVTAPMWYLATSGLEGGLTFAWLGALFFVLARWAVGTRTLSKIEWVLVGLGWLVRPELILFSLAAAIVVVVGGKSDRSFLRSLAATAWAWLVPLAYELFRMGYFASLLANTAYAKEASGVRWGQGWAYLWQFVGMYWLWLAGACLVVGGYLPMLARLIRLRDRRFALMIAWVAASLLSTVYVVRIGGDYVDARLLLPSFFAFCVPVAVIRVAPTTSWRASSWIAGIALVGWTCVAAFALRPVHAYVTVVGDDRRNVVTLSDALSGWEGKAYAYLRVHRYTFDLGPLAGAPNPALKHRTAALSGIGIFGYALGNDVDVFDLTALADPVAAHFELPTRGLPGHEKVDPPAWSVARLVAPGDYPPPELFTSPVDSRPLIPVTHGLAFVDQVDAAQHALQCGQLKAMQESYQGPLDLGRFASNIVRSFTNSRLTIPPDPGAAERKFCGRGGS